MKKQPTIRHIEACSSWFFTIPPSILERERPNAAESLLKPNQYSEPYLLPVLTLFWPGPLLFVIDPIGWVLLQFCRAWQQPRRNNELNFLLLSSFPSGLFVQVIYVYQSDLEENLITSLVYFPQSGNGPHVCCRPLFSACTPVPAYQRTYQVSLFWLLRNVPLILGALLISHILLIWPFRRTTSFDCSRLFIVVSSHFLLDLVVHQLRPTTPKQNNDPWSSCLLPSSSIQLGTHMALSALQVPNPISAWFQLGFSSKGLWNSNWLYSSQHRWTKQTELESKEKMQLLTQITKQDNLSSEQSETEGLLDVQKTARHFLVQEIQVVLDNLRTLTLTLSEWFICRESFNWDWRTSDQFWNQNI